MLSYWKFLHASVVGCLVTFYYVSICQEFLLCSDAEKGMYIFLYNFPLTVVKNIYECAWNQFFMK